MKLGELIELVIRALPHPNQIKDIEIINSSDPACIRFTWRSNRYQISQSAMVETVSPKHRGILITCDASILMKSLLERARQNP